MTLQFSTLAALPQDLGSISSTLMGTQTVCNSMPSSGFCDTQKSGKILKHINLKFLKLERCYLKKSKSYCIKRLHITMHFVM